MALLIIINLDNMLFAIRRPNTEEDPTRKKAMHDTLRSGKDCESGLLQQQQSDPQNDEIWEFYLIRQDCQPSIISSLLR